MPKAQYTLPTPTQRDCRVASRLRCVHEFATNSRRLPTDLVMWTQPSAVTEFTIAVNAIEVGWRNIMTLRVSKHSNQPCSVTFVNFYNFLINNDVIMSSLVSTGNCKLGHDCRRNCRQLVANSCSHRRRRRDKTVSSRQRRRCVLGINRSPNLGIHPVWTAVTIRTKMNLYDADWKCCCGCQA